MPNTPPTSWLHDPYNQSHGEGLHFTGTMMPPHPTTKTPTRRSTTLWLQSYLDPYTPSMTSQSHLSPNKHHCFQTSKATPKPHVTHIDFPYLMMSQLPAQIHRLPQMTPPLFSWTQTARIFIFSIYHPYDSWFIVYYHNHPFPSLRLTGISLPRFLLAGIFIFIIIYYHHSHQQFPSLRRIHGISLPRFLLVSTTGGDLSPDGSASY